MLLKKKIELEKNHVDQSASLQVNPVTMDSDDDAYGKMVERAKEYIRQGDAFQIVPFASFSAAFSRK